MSVDQAGQDVGEVGFRLDVVDFTAFDEGGVDRPVGPAFVAAGKQGILAIQSSCAVILPMSVRRS